MAITCSLLALMSAILLLLNPFKMLLLGSFPWLIALPICPSRGSGSSTTTKYKPLTLIALTLFHSDILAYAILALTIMPASSLSTSVLSPCVPLFMGETLSQFVKPPPYSLINFSLKHTSAIMLTISVWIGKWWLVFCFSSKPVFL